MHGGDIRVYSNSGVYLTKPPFNLPAQALRELLGVPSVGIGKENDQGVIRHFSINQKANKALYRTAITLRPLPHMSRR